MGADFLHGVEVIDVDSGANAIRPVKSSVIGIVGTAPDAESAKSPFVLINTVNAQASVRVTLAAYVGGGYNGVMTMRVHAPSEPNSLFSFALSEGSSIVVSLATDATGAVTTTVGDMVAQMGSTPGGCWFEPAAEGVDLVDIEDDIVAPCGLRVFDGGQDEPFPLNRPVLVPGDRRLAAKLGPNGTLPAAMDAIFDQAGAMVVVVRVPVGANDAATKANIMGGVDSGTGDYTGVHALLSAETLLGVQPRILIAPGFTQDAAVTGEMIGVANRLRAHIVADGPNTNDAAATAFRHGFGSRRVYIVDPGLRIYSPAQLEEIDAVASPRVAGLIARVDNEMGFWHSPSNKEIYGNIVGTKRPVDFALGDPNCRANYLNEQEVATIIRKDGFRLWGNRTCSTDLRYAFLSVSRTCDMIDDAILRSHMWAVDRNISATYVRDVVDGVNDYLRYLASLGAIVDGRCWVDQEINTPTRIASGQVFFDYDFAPSYPAERVTFRRRINNSYLEEIF